MKKILCCLLALSLAFSLLTAAGAPVSAEGDPEIVTYIYGDVNVYDASSVLFLTAGAQFYARQEIDGKPFDPPALGEWVSVSPTPVTPGPDLFGREEQPYYLCTVQDDIPENMATSGGILIEDDELGFVFYKTCGFITGPKKDVYAETKTGERFEDGATVELAPGETLLLRFHLTGGDAIASSAWSLDPEQILIAGWYADPLRKAGFTVPNDPVTEGNEIYVSVGAGDLQPGTEAVLPIWFVQMRSVFGENALGWDKAPVVYRGTLTFRVEGEAKTRAPGDADGDGKVTASDARLALRRSVDLETFEKGSEAFTACDVDGDGKVTAADARLILRAAVGLEELGGQTLPGKPDLEKPDLPEVPTDPGIPVPVDPNPLVEL